MNSVEKKSKWLWPLGLAAATVAAASVVVFRGCWHRKMSWPVRFKDHSYQVCLGCGIKRLFDVDAFRAYGPYSYDLADLVQRERDSRVTEIPLPKTLPAERRSAS